MRVLLTGATGKAGRRVCRELHEAGFEVIACDRSMGGELPVRVRMAELLDRVKCYELVEGAETVVHLAAYPNDRVGVPPEVLFNENVSMTVNLLQASRDLGVGKFVFASSVQAMAHPRHQDDEGRVPPSRLEYLPADGRIPAHPGTPYGLSKHICEEVLQFFSREHGIDCIACRFPHLISPRYLEYYRDRERHSSGAYARGYWRYNYDECFSGLTTQDAGRLVASILNSDLPGYRCYFPTAPTPLTRTPVPALIESYFADVPLRRPAEELTHLIDISEITRDTGWRPLDDIGEMIRSGNQPD